MSLTKSVPFSWAEARNSVQKTDKVKEIEGEALGRDENEGEFDIPTFKTQRGQCQEHNFFEVSYYLYKYYYFYFFFFLLKVELKFSWLTRVLGDQYVEMDGESQRPW